MKSFKGTLVLAGACAAVGLGCSHYRSARESTPEPATTQTQPTTTLPTTPNAPPPGSRGAEMGVGGAGQDTGGLPGSTPTTTTPSSIDTSTTVPTNPLDTSSSIDTSSSTTLPSQPGVGGSGVNPDACNRNQIGSPGSSDVICPPDEHVTGTGTGGSGMSTSGETTSSGTSSGTLSSDVGMVGSSDLEKENKELRKQIKELKKENKELKKSGTGGSGVDESAAQTTETTKVTKQKKHSHKKTEDKKAEDRKVQDEKGTGGSGTFKDEDMTRDQPKDESKDLDQTQREKTDKLP